MSGQPMTNEEVTTPVESAKTDSPSRQKWSLLVAVAFLILIELGGMLLLGYRCENLTPVQVLQNR